MSDNRPNPPFWVRARLRDGFRRWDLCGDNDEILIPDFESDVDALVTANRLNEVYEAGREAERERADYWEAVTGQYSEFEEYTAKLREAVSPYVIVYPHESDWARTGFKGLRCRLCYAEWPVGNPDKHNEGCVMIPPDPILGRVISPTNTPYR